MAAQAMRRPQAGGRYVWATVVVLVIIGLFAGILALVFFYEPYMDDLLEMNNNIETALYNPLQKLGIDDLPKAPETGERKTPWRLEFFQKVHEYAKHGKMYQDEVRTHGYLPEDKAVQLMEEAIAQATREQVSPRPNTLKEYVDGLVAANRTHRNTIEELKKSRADTQDKFKQMTRLRDQLQNIVGKKVAEGDEKLRAMRERMLEDYKKLQEANNQLSKELERVRKERNTLNAQVRQQRDKSDTQVKQLREQVTRLEDELTRKQPRKKKDIVGHVRQADMIRKFAIVGLGSREGIKLGDELRISRIGRGGVDIKKATGKVVHVGEFVSRVDLFDIEEEFPVIEGDIVVPVKKAVDALKAQK